MLAYTKDELMSSTEIVRNFSTILDSIKKHEREKVAVMRKNRLEAVILSVDEYERIQGLADIIEHFQIYKTVKEREATPQSAYVDFDRILDEHGLSNDDI
jgi:PHD/YefM family antitoxin component YafN of YafNO toxin-antitoxin module